MHPDDKIILENYRATPTRAMMMKRKSNYVIVNERVCFQVADAADRPCAYTLPHGEIVRGSRYAVSVMQQ